MPQKEKTFYNVLKINRSSLSVKKINCDVSNIGVLTIFEITSLNILPL
tara:strand:- start:18323 stop:18466 length:144 start_codon:yes stop_codon:yes gene_type:complete